MKLLIVIPILFLAATSVFGTDQSKILGIWQTELDESKVEMYRCGERLCGKIIWLKKPIYTDSQDGVVGTPVIDRKNPDSSLRNRPLIGLQILDRFTSVNGITWENGTCYDPKSGKTYRGKLHLAAPDRLELRGFIGIPLFGRSSVWTR